MTDAELDESLREAMRAWPTPTPAMDLAAVAVARARRAAVRRVRRWTIMANGLAAIVAVGAVAMFIRARLVNGGFSAWSDGTAATTSATPPWVLIAAAIVMGAIAVVAARSAWDTADDGIRWAA